MKSIINHTKATFFCALTLLCLTQSLMAQTNLWIGGGASSNWSAPGNWTNGAPTSGEALYFGGATSQNNNNDLSGLNLGAVTFLNAGWNIAGNAVGLTNGFTDGASNGTNIVGIGVSLAKAAAVTVATNEVLVFTGTLSGIGGITKSGTGTAVLASANSYTGNTTNSAGTLQLGNGGTTGDFGHSPTVALSRGGAAQGTINANLIINETGSPVFTNGLFLSSGNQAVYVSAGQTAFLTGPISGSGQLWVNGPGLLVISNTGSSYTASGGLVLNNTSLGGLQFDSLSEFAGFTSKGFYLDGGSLIYAGPTASGLSGVPFAFQNNTNVISVANPATTLTINAIISSTAPFVKSGPGTLALGAVNTYTGTTTISNGTLALASSGSITKTPTITVCSNATFDVSANSGFSLGTAQTLAGSGSVNGSVSLTSGTIAPGINLALGTLTFNNNLTVNGAAFNIGLGATPSGPNDSVQVLGTLENDSATVINLNYGFLSPGIYTLMTYGSLTGSGSFSLNQTLTNATLNVGATAVTLTVGAGGFRNYPSSLVWVGDGSANNWDVQTTTNWLNFATPDYYYQGDNVLFTDTGSTNPPVNLATTLSPGNVTVNSTKAYVFGGSGQLSGPMSLAKLGSGTLVIATANTYGGNTTISNGTIQLGNGGTTGDFGYSPTIALNRAGGGVNGSGVALAVNETSSPVFTNGLSLASGDEAIYVNAGQTAVFTGPISGTGQLWANGPGTLAISNQGAAYTYSGGIVLGNSALGTLQFDNISDLGNGSSSGSIFFGHAGGTLSYVGPSATMTQLANDCFQGYTNVINVANPATTLTSSGVMTGNGGTVVKSGPGTLALSAVDTFNGNTVISNGTLALIDSGSIADTAAITICSNAVFDVSGLGNFSPGASQTLSGSGSVNGSVSATTGAISPGLGASAPGTLTFSNNLTLNSTTLTFGLGQDDPGVSSEVQVLGTLENDGTTLINLTYGYASPGTYTLLTYPSLTGSGTFALSGGYTNVTLNVGTTAITVTIGAGGLGSLVNLSWVGDGIANHWNLTSTNWTDAGGSIAFAQGDDVTFSDGGSITPPVNLTTTLLPGAVTVNSSNTYVFAGSGQLSGPMSLTLNGSGVVVMTTTNSYTGSTIVNNGMLQLGNGSANGNTGAGAIVLATGAAAANGAGDALAIDAAGTPVYTNAVSLADVGVGHEAIYVNAGQKAIFTGPISGGGQFWVNGPGILVISNPGAVYAYSGGTVLGNSSLGGLQFDSVGELGSGNIYFNSAGGSLIYAGPSDTVSNLTSSAFQGGINVISVVNPTTVLTSSGVMTGTGTFVKSGPGALDLTGVNTFTAGTIVSNGTLLVDGSYSSSSAAAITVYGGAGLGGMGLVGTVTVEPAGLIQGGGTNGSGIFSIAYTLNLGTTTNAATDSEFCISNGGTVYATALNVTGTNVVNIEDTTLAVGNYPLFSYNTITYGANSGFRVGTLPAGVTANIADTGSSINLNVTSVSTPPPAFGGIAPLPDHNFQLTFNGQDGQGYTVWETTNLALPLSDWGSLTTGTFTGSAVTFEDVNATNYPQRFYLITSP